MMRLHSTVAMLCISYFKTFPSLQIAVKTMEGAENLNHAHPLSWGAENLSHAPQLSSLFAAADNASGPLYNITHSVPFNLSFGSR
jgi:hypothetical protein